MDKAPAWVILIYLKPCKSKQTMKKIILSLAVAVAAISCNTNEEVIAPSIEKGEEITIDVLSSGVADAATRTVTTDEGDEWIVKWATGDKVFGWSTSADGATTDEKITALNMATDGLSEDGLTATFTGTVANDMLRLVYCVGNPAYDKVNKTVQMNLSAQNVDMNAALNTLKSAYMITSGLTDKTEGLTPVMEHVTAGFKLGLQFSGLPEGNTYRIKSIEIGGGTEAEDFVQVPTLIKGDLRLGVDDPAFRKSATYNPSTLTVTNSPVIDEDTPCIMYMSLFPFSVEAGKSIKIKVYLTVTLPDGNTTPASKEFAITNTTGSTIEFDRGRYHLLGKKCDFTGVEISTPLEGTGTADDPYQVKSVQDLKTLASDVAGKDMKLGKYFALQNDIDLGCDADNQWAPIGVSNQIPFKGIFDGQGHTISGLYSAYNANNLGLFGCVSAGVVKNLHVEGFVGATAGSGGISGLVNGGATIINCSFSGIISGPQQVGGIVGNIANNAKVINCYNLGSVEAKTGNQAGGIVGYNNNAFVYNCYNVGAVKGTKNTTGGVIGQNGKAENQTNNYSLSGCVTCSIAPATTAVNGTEYDEATMKSQTLVDGLNKYVTEYNATNPAHAAKEWTVTAGGYPTFK